MLVRAYARADTAATLHGAALRSESTALQGQQVLAETQLLQACQLAPGGVSAHSSSHWRQDEQYSLNVLLLAQSAGPSIQLRTNAVAV
jgi:hypothetical protein